MTEESPSELMTAAREELSKLPFCEVLSFWNHHDDGHWSLLIDVSTSDHGNLPRHTRWYCVIENCFPRGKIEFFPAIEGGLTQTFQHQAYNGECVPSRPWRSGKVCLHMSFLKRGLIQFKDEPNADKYRVLWYAARLQEWLRRAGKGSVIQDGEPDELPALPHASSGCTIGFSENKQQYVLWQKQTCRCGIVRFLQVSRDPKHHVSCAQSFETPEGEEIVKIKTGDFFDRKISGFGIWLKTSKIPVIDPWQLPTTFEELRCVLSKDLNTLKSVLVKTDNLLRDGKRHPLLIGFPFSKIKGSNNYQLHWLGINLPVLAKGQQKGFRNTPEGLLKFDLLHELHPKQRIEWIQTQNWDTNERSSRGRLSESLTKQKIVIVGVGSLGSMIAELLARGGCDNLVLCDPDRLEMGNLSRHVLTMDDLGSFKVDALAARLRSVNPDLNIEAISARYPIAESYASDLIKDCSIVIETTGSDTILKEMDRLTWSSPGMIVSVSMGLYARQTFVYFSNMQTFHSEEFFRAIKPYLDNENDWYKNANLPREGIGCWSFVFPAKGDDIMLAACASVKEIESFVSKPHAHSGLTVFEQYESTNGFGGIRRVEPKCE